MVLVGDSGNEARYRLLETIRQYGQDQLLESGEAEELRRRHRDWFLALAERAERELHGPEQLRWSEMLEVELENLRAAFEWSLQMGDTEAGLRFATALGRFWHVRGHLSDGQDWLERSLARGDGPTSLRAQALAWEAQLAFYLGDFERATRLSKESLGLFRRVSNQRGAGFALRILGLIAVGQDEYEHAAALLEESLAALRVAGDKSSSAESLYYLGRTRAFTGDPESAVARIEEALSLFRDLGDKRFIALSLGALGRVALGQGRYEPAADLLDKSVVLLRDLKDQSGVTFLVALGTVERCQGDFERAKMILEESLSSFRRIGQNYRAADSLCQLGIVARLESNLGRAAALLQESLSVGRRDRYGVSRCLEALAGLACQQGELLRGANLFGAAHAMRERIAAPLDPFDINDHDIFVASAQARLGEAGFRQAWFEGQAMTQEEAIAFASDQPVTRIREGHITR